MQEKIVTTTLALPDAPLYVVVAIFVAITAMTAADIRDKSRLLPRAGVNNMTITLFAGSWISLSHIFLDMIGKNDFYALSSGAVAGMFTHSLALVLLLIAVSIWYWAVAIHKETSAGIPASPVADQ